MIMPQNVARHELIGLSARVIRSGNPSAEGICGVITDETQNTLEIGGKTVFKGGAVFEITLPSKVKVKLDGDKICARPWERIKKGKKNG